MGARRCGPSQNEGPSTSYFCMGVARGMWTQLAAGSLCRPAMVASFLILGLTREGAYHGIKEQGEGLPGMASGEKTSQRHSEEPASEVQAHFFVSCTWGQMC